MRQGVLWIKPRHVDIASGALVADLMGGTSYPLVDAVKKGRAFRSLVDVRNDDDARLFTETWGLLYLRLENGRVNAFPLERFHAERRYLIDLSNLSNAMRTGNAARVEEVLRVCGASKKALTSSLREDPFEADLTEHERHLVAQGRDPMDVFIARYTGQVLGPTDYAGRLLAEELDLPRRLHFARRNRESQLEEVLDLRTLSQALRWTLRTQYKVLHHIVCESCGNDAMVRRADGRYCSEACAGRARAQRFRERQPSR